MSIVLQSHAERQQARRFLLEGDFAGAISRARASQELAETPAGDAIARVATCLTSIGDAPPPDPGGRPPERA